MLIVQMLIFIFNLHALTRVNQYDQVFPISRLITGLSYWVSSYVIFHDSHCSELCGIHSSYGMPTELSFENKGVSHVRDFLTLNATHENAQAAFPSSYLSPHHPIHVVSVADNEAKNLFRNATLTVVVHRVQSCPTPAYRRNSYRHKYLFR